MSKHLAEIENKTMCLASFKSPGELKFVSKDVVRAPFKLIFSLCHSSEEACKGG